MATPSEVTVEYYLKNGQIGWALAAIIVGMPASWKGLGMIGQFISRRFETRDGIVDRLLKSHEEELKVRMAEATGVRETAAAMREMAHAVFALAKTFQEAKS